MNEVANKNGINILDRNGKKLPFKTALDRVCKRINFIPQEFSEDGYRLFKELSNLIHDEFDEEEALTKYPALSRLVLAVLDKQINREEIGIARVELEWNADAEDRN